MDPAVLIVTLTGDIYVKSDRTRARFHRRLSDNLRQALAARAGRSHVRWLDAGRLLLTADRLEDAARAAASTFGVYRVEQARPLPTSSLTELADAAGEAARPQVADRTFAVRVRRHGRHSWRSLDAEREIGARLVDASAGVDLDDPEVTVPVVVIDDRAWLVTHSWKGPGGMPLGTQESALALISGGFDSPVAAWMVMRRGSPVDFLHVELDCAQSDHALAVAHQLWRRWGAGTSPLAWLVDFGQVEDLLTERVPSRLRQVVLKQLMFETADRVAAETHQPALITGEALGQVSSQTLHHLAEIDRSCTRTVLRPLAGFDKDEIVTRAHEIGTGPLSARAKELCNLSSGPGVAVAAQRETLARAQSGLPADVAADAARRRRVIALEHWTPGMEAVPVVDQPPPDTPLITADNPPPAYGPAAFSGDRAPHAASRLKAAGREVYVVRGLHEPPSVEQGRLVTAG